MLPEVVRPRRTARWPSRRARRDRASHRQVETRPVAEDAPQQPVSISIGQGIEYLVGSRAISKLCDVIWMLCAIGHLHVREDELLRVAIRRIALTDLRKI